MPFLQDPPRLPHPYDGDPVLGSHLRRTLPAEVFADVGPGLRALGARAGGEMLELAAAAEAQPPRLVEFDPWGRRIDRIQVSDAWRALHEIAAEEGIVAAGYERAHGEHSRVHQFARLYLYHPSSALYSCPLAMGDGAARTLELHGTDAQRERWLHRLTSRDPEVFWTAGQWMTERAGGSDVSNTETEARPIGEDAQGLAPVEPHESHRLWGTKWFTSATTAELALTLARDPEAAGEGSGALSLFLVRVHDDSGALRGIRIRRLKDKLGTRALPTAELDLVGTPAERVGPPGRGVATIASVLNITRLYNACCAAATMRRGLALAIDYAGRRHAFGRALIDHPLHREVLASLETETRAAFHLVFRAAALLGRVETGAATEDEIAALRLLTPLVKLYTGKRAVAVASETLECFGGAGYIEDTGLPVLLRDAQVLPIWEGTTSVLALDALRTMARGRGLAHLLADARGAAGEASSSPDLAERAAHRVIASYRDPEQQRGAEAEARRLAFALSRALAGAYLLEHAAWESAAGAVGATGGVAGCDAREAAVRWIAGPSLG